MEKSFKEHWANSNPFQKFEISIGLILCVFLAVIIILTLVRLSYSTLIVAYDPPSASNAQSTQVIFGIIVTILLALELVRAILHNIKNHSVIIHTNEMILIGIIALVRKLIIIDHNQVATFTLLGLAASIAALAGSYWVLLGSKKGKA